MNRGKVSKAVLHICKGGAMASEHMDWDDLRIFLAVARTLSFSQAALHCHLSQPALSATVKKLEETLGVKLFERTTRRTRLTWAVAVQAVSAALAG